MAPVYADHPFPLIPTPVFQGKEESRSFQVRRLTFLSPGQLTMSSPTCTSVWPGTDLPHIPQTKHPINLTYRVSEMANVHNMIIRGVNSIYLQAPHVKPADVPAFVQYCIQWYRLLDVHHTTEETDFFVAVEKVRNQWNWSTSIKFRTCEPSGLLLTATRPR
jgi:hypothetical protein